MHEPLRTADGRLALRFERHLDHPQEKVWRAITDPAHLSQWYPFTVTELDLTVGGKITFDDGAGTTLAGVVQELDPPRVFAFSEEDDLLHLELRPHGSGCTLVFTHTFAEANAAPGAGEGWRRCLDTLTTLVTASASDDRLGTVVTVEGRTALRFERLLPHPPAKVWRALTEAEQLRTWFAAVVDRDLTTGARVRFTATPEAKQAMAIPDGEDSFGSGVVTVAEPYRLLEYSWGGETLRWELAEDPAGCRLVFTDLLDGDEAASDACAGWHAALEVLRARLDGRAVTWSAWDRLDPLTAVYARAMR